MATGRSNQLTKQVGEYLVASELARRGLVVATFSGNIPDFDLIATDKEGSSCAIQVKTINGGAWQFSIGKFAEIAFNKKKQIIGKKIPLTNPRMVCVFVIAAENYGSDVFFIVEWSNVQNILIRNYKKWLESHGGVRPRNPESLHCSILPPELIKYRNNWSLIDIKLK